MRRFYKIGIVLIVALATWSAHAQNIEQVEIPVQFNDMTWFDKGFDFYIGGGACWGNKFNANYYNGSNLNENSLYNAIFQYAENSYDGSPLDQLEQMLSQHYQNIGSDVLCRPKDDPGGDYDWETRYKTSMLVSFGVRYKIGKGWGIALSYSYGRLIATSRCLLTPTISVGGNLNTLPEMLMVGKEDRSTIDLSASYLFSQVHPMVKPFMELGAQFNYAKLKSFEANLLDQTGNAVGTPFNLVNRTGPNGVGQFAQQYDFTYGGAGFGFSGAVGLKIVCGKFVSIDPTFYCYTGMLGIFQQKDSWNDKVAESMQKNRFTMNYGFLVRIVMNDFFVARNR